MAQPSVKGQIRISLKSSPSAEERLAQRKAENDTKKKKFSLEFPGVKKFQTPKKDNSQNESNPSKKKERNSNLQKNKNHR